MDTVQSKDGTTIAYERSGSGPAVVFVVGAFCDRGSFASLGAELAPDFTVYAYDRRGRGGSGDSIEYSIGAEVEDLRAVVEAAGGEPFVYGHSSGAALALEAASRGVSMRKLAVYEAPYMSEDERDATALGDLQRLVAAGDREGASVRFLALTGAPPQVVEMIKQGPGWPGMCAIAHTLPYDVTLTDHGSRSLDWANAIETKTLVMSGGDSPPWAAAAAARIVGEVSGARLSVIPGQGHSIADDAIAPVLRDFFSWNAALGHRLRCAQFLPRSSVNSGLTIL